MSELSVVGGIVFGDMFNVLAWGVFVSLCAIVLATLAEGRGSHALKVLMGLKNRDGGLDLYETLARDEDDWRLLARLEESDAVRWESVDAGVSAVARQPGADHPDAARVGTVHSGAVRTVAPRPNAATRTTRVLRVPERSSSH